LAHGLTYASFLLLILGAHEMGHYFACRYYRVPATLPFFIPFFIGKWPTVVGTLGAVIRIRGPIPSRRALFDIAAAGPIAGFAVAFPLLVVGIARAKESFEPIPPHGFFLGIPLCSTLIGQWLRGGANLEIKSLYGAAWVGMLVTSMNLFPVGQLDGGHAVFAVSPRFHRFFSWATIIGLAALIAQQLFVDWSPSAYTLWLVILIILRGRHPRLLDESEPLGSGRKAVAIVLTLIFVLTFMPVPVIVR
jgi:membrane-associated protease RseP (regulator of RpoE activity)